MADPLYPHVDVLDVASDLRPSETAAILGLRSYLATIPPDLLSRHWEAGTFPEELIPGFVALDLISPLDVVAEQGRIRSLFEGFRSFELARVDASLATWFGGQAGLFRKSILLGGSDAQIAHWDPLVTSFGVRGAFALTEPQSGSDIARGLATTARREGDRWTLSGAKRWIGNATLATHLVVFARDAADGEVKGFIVDAKAPGVSMSVIGGKTALRMVQNADIAFADVRVGETHRLQRINSFSDVSAVLRAMRGDVAWFAAGIQSGAYEAARGYTMERLQFGRPLASFQLVQSHLSAMLGNITASLAMVSMLSRRQDEGVYRDDQSAMAKSWVTTRMRDTVARAREVVGGNGILLEHRVARFHADAEAVYSYEGTREINDLIVARAATGHSAFV